MAARCPHCDIVLTSVEARARTCPSCGKRLGSLTPSGPSANPKSDAAAQTPPVRENLAFLPLFGILFVGGVVFAGLSAILTSPSNAGATGGSMGVALTYGILHGMGYVGNKKAAARA